MDMFPHLTTLEEVQTFIVSCPEPVKLELDKRDGCFIARFFTENDRLGWTAGRYTVEEAVSKAAEMALGYFAGVSK